MKFALEANWPTDKKQGVGPLFCSPTSLRASSLLGQPRKERARGLGPRPAPILSRLISLATILPRLTKKRACSQPAHQHRTKTDNENRALVSHFKLLSILPCLVPARLSPTPHDQISSVTTEANAFSLGLRDSKQIDRAERQRGACILGNILPR